MQWKWNEVKPGLFRLEPSPGHVYECERVNYRSGNYFARHNGRMMRTGRNKTYRQPLGVCKNMCERHHLMNTMGGEVS